jgi:hypothetical protein
MDDVIIPRQVLPPDGVIQTIDLTECLLGTKIPGMVNLVPHDSLSTLPQIGQSSL